MILQIQFTRGLHGHTFITGERYSVGEHRPSAGEIDEWAANALLRSGQATPVPDASAPAEEDDGA